MVIQGLDNAIYGTLFTWGLTALGAACVLVVPGNRRDILDVSLGFSGGVMLAASYWSLLDPALKLAEDQGYGKLSFIPISVGILLGATFVLLADFFLPENILIDIPKPKSDEDLTNIQFAECDNIASNGDLRQRKLHNTDNSDNYKLSSNSTNLSFQTKQIRRLMLLIIAITVHNFPEGLAVGVGYASVGRPGVTLQDAHNLALGIGLQNFPEGLAVSVPLKAAGYSTGFSFFWGQASGMVEPIAGILGALCVTLVEQILSVALSFAAGAMIWVVCNDIIPECAAHNHTRLCSLGIMVGFVVMMALDTGLA